MCFFIYPHSSSADNLTALSDTLISFDTSSTRYLEKKTKNKNRDESMKQKNEAKKKKKVIFLTMLFPPVLATFHLIIRVFFLPSFKDDEPGLAEEEGSPADSRTTNNRYKTNNFLIHVIAVLAGE